MHLRHSDHPTRRRSRPADRPARPTALQWLRYAYGGGLPARLAPWVLADTTAPGWVRRHLTRALVQLLPVLVLCLTVVPAPFSYRVSAAAGGLLLGLMLSAVYIVETTEHRVAKAGYPAGSAARVRAERREREQRRRREVQFGYRRDGAGSFD